MKKIKLFVAALGLMGAMTANAQTDVTASLTNAGFNPEAEPLGWTWENSSLYFDHGMGLIGTYQVRGEHPTATVDETHLNTEFCLGLECRWSTNYSAATQTVTLPEGAYRVSFDVENTNGSTTKATYQNRFTVTVGETVYTDTNIEWMNGKSAWTNHTIDFTVNEETAVTFSFGYGTGSNNFGVGNTPTLYVSHLSLTHQSILDGVKSLWDEAKEAAATAYESEDYANVTGSEKVALEAELAKAEPTTKEGYEEATAALNAAKDAFVAAKAVYDLVQTVPTLAYAGVEKPVVTSETVAAELLTAIRAYYESHAKAEGVNGAVDMTDRINGAQTPNNNAWTWTGNKNNPASNEPWTDADGNATHSYYDGGNWGANSWTTTMKQTVDVPAGKYLLTAKGRAAVNTTMTMAVGEDVVTFPSIGAAVGTGVFNRGWNDASVEFTTEGDPIEILVTASTSTLHEWFSISDFRLVQLEAITIPLADEADYEDLASAIETAEAKVLGFEEGEYAPYNNVEALAALAAAKAINPAAEEGNKQERVQNLTTALNEAVWTANSAEVNAIFDGQFATTEANATSGDINLPGWTKVEGIRLLVKDAEVDPGLAYTEGGAAVFAWGGTTLTYGEQEGYTLPLKADKTYKLSFKVSGWRDGDFPTVVNVNLDGAVQNVNASGFAPINATDVNPFVSYNVLVTPAADNSVLKIYANHHFTVADLSLVEFVPEEVAFSENEVVSIEVSGLPVNVTVERPMVAGEWAAVALPFAANVAEVFGEGAQVAEFQGATETTLSFATSEAETLRAGVPYLVKVAEDKDVLTAQNVVLTEELSTVENLGEPYAFVPVINGQFIDAGAAYVAHGNLIKTLAEPSYIKGFRGIFYKNATEEVVEGKLTLVVDGETTGIATISAQGTEVETGAVYNMAGQRVNKAQKGVYIVNGKKVVLK